MPLKQLQLFTLGRLALVSTTGEDAGLNKRLRKLAFLAVVALSTRPPTRDKLAAMFWGDEDEERARHSVSDTLSHLRRVLGRDAIAARSAVVTLADNVRLAVDAIEFSAACESHDFARAFELYAGPFLADVSIGASPDFDLWVDRERDRYSRLFIRVCEAYVPSLARAGDWVTCAQAATRWLEVVPESSDAALYLLKALSADGSGQAATTALDRYDALVGILARERSTKPATAVSEFAAGLAARQKEDDLAVPVTASNPADNNSRSASPALPRRRSPRYIGIAVTCLVIVIAVAAVALRRKFSTANAEPARPIVAIMHFQNVRADSSVAWLVDGFNQMIASDLSRSSAVEVIAPERVREVIARGELSDDSALSTNASISIAKRVGATWVVSGGITRGADVYVMDISVRSAATGDPVRMFSVTGSDILMLADQAAAHILNAANADAPGPRLAEIETSNVAAFQHYVRAVQARDEGRFGDQVRELDLAILADSGFVSALTARLRIAEDLHDRPTIATLASAFERSSGRATDWDRLQHTAWSALHNGEHSRAESLGAELVRRYPHDPRAYAMQAEILTSHGKWPEAATVLEHALSLDSLAVEAGRGPCVPCTAYDGLVNLRLMTGDLAAAEHDARRWTAVEPDAPAAWLSLALTLVYSGHFDPAIDAARRATMLAGDDPHYAVRVVRILLMARRYAAVDSAIAAWHLKPEGAYQANAGDLQAMVQRERGQYRASNTTLRRLTSRYPDASDLRLVMGNNFARLGMVDSAAILYETIAHTAGQFDSRSPYFPLEGDDARGFSWHHALEADAIAQDGDTVRLRILADSIEMVSSRSYYGRDQRLPHHIRGLIAMRAGRFSDAVQELQRARWGVSGWTATVAQLARAYLALGRPRDAVATLRDAYMEPPDAMGRYEPRTELDLLMAQAFRAAGQLDSSAVYANYVRSAWRNAEPEARARLAQFDRNMPDSSTTHAAPRRPTALSRAPTSQQHEVP